MFWKLLKMRFFDPEDTGDVSDDSAETKTDEVDLDELYGVGATADSSQGPSVWEKQVEDELHKTREELEALKNKGASAPAKPTEENPHADLEEEYADDPVMLRVMKEQRESEARQNQRFSKLEEKLTKSLSGIEASQKKVEDNVAAQRSRQAVAAFSENAWKWVKETFDKDSKLAKDPVIREYLEKEVAGPLIENFNPKGDVSSQVSALKKILLGQRKSIDGAIVDRSGEQGESPEKNREDAIKRDQSSRNNLSGTGGRPPASEPSKKDEPMPIDSHTDIFNALLDADKELDAAEKAGITIEELA